MHRYSLKVEKDPTVLVFSLTFLVQDRNNNVSEMTGLNTGIPNFLVKIRTGSVQCFPGIDFKVCSYHK